jgi:hypothetical protein
MIRILDVWSEKKGLQKAKLHIEESEHPFIQLTFSGYDSGKIESDKLYHCLTKLHKQLDEVGIKLLCQGCRYDVKPSGMSLSMGQGVVAYRHEIAQPAIEKVNIFDATDDLNAIKPLEEKNKFFDTWIASMREK